MECLGFQLGYLICFVSRFIFFFSYCYSWLFVLCGRSVAGIQSVSPALVSRSAASAPCGCSLWKAAGQVGGPSCPSGAPLMSQCLSMGLRGHVHKAVQSHLFMARDTNFESGWASFAKILSKLWKSGEFCLFFQACWVIWGFTFVWLSLCWVLFCPRRSGNQNYHWFQELKDTGYIYFLFNALMSLRTCLFF